MVLYIQQAWKEKQEIEYPEISPRGVSSKEVAMKFYGYRYLTSFSSVFSELKILRTVPSFGENSKKFVCRLKGFFMDTEEGILTALPVDQRPFVNIISFEKEERTLLTKENNISYHIILTERMFGGDLFDRISCIVNQKAHILDEQYVSRLFCQLIKTITFVHVKLEW